MDVFFDWRWWIENRKIGKYNTIWDRVSADIKKEYNSKPIYNKFLKTKIKFDRDDPQIFMIKKFLMWTLISLI